MSAENWLGLLLLSAIKASLLLGLAWLLVRLRRPGSAAARHLIWTAAVGGAILLPFASQVAPGWRFDSLSNTAPRWLVEPSQAAIEQMTSLPPFIVAADASRPWQEHVALALWWIWIAGVLMLAFGLVLGSLRLGWLAWRATPVEALEWQRTKGELAAALGIRRPISLLISRERMMPVTWGMLRPRVLLPAGCLDWPVERIRVVLGHELAHVCRHDWAVQMLAEFGRAIYWFNPMMWAGCNRLRTESELASDDAVLGLGVRPPVYAEVLVEMARSFRRPEQAWLPALAVARQSNLERRLISMLNPKQDRRMVTAKSAVAAASIALCLVLPLAALQTLSGKFYGTVFDPSGGVVPNATVIAANAEGKTRDMTTTSAAGAFEFIDLPPGRYNVEVLKPGFMRNTSANVVLEGNKNQHLNITLDVGTITERVEVVAQGTPKERYNPNATPQRVRVGGNVQATKLVHRVNPAYPPVAKAAGIQGSVVLEAIINKEGSLLSLRVMNSQVDADLARAAVEAVSQWKYQPTLLNGEPVEVIVRIDVNFTLAP